MTKAPVFSFGNPFLFLASNLLAELQHPWPSAFERKGAEGRVAAVIVPLEKLPATFPPGQKGNLAAGPAAILAVIG
jgi:hypothetical protein